MHHRACYHIQEVSVTLQPESCSEHFACVERRVRTTMACIAYCGVGIVELAHAKAPTQQLCCKSYTLKMLLSSVTPSISASSCLSNGAV
jgi:hypothetical protein